MRAARILVVDDEPVNRRLLKDLLGPMGYDVIEAADGEAALASVAESRPDLVLLDLMMPRRDGYSVCQELKGNAETRLIPVIILTTLEQLPDKLKAVELGADDYLNKPFNTLELTTRVRSLLSLKRFTDDLEHAGRVLESIARVIEGRDRYTGDHCQRLGGYGVRIGTALGLGEEDLKTLWLGGIFHDLGKVAVSDAVLNKPDRLTPEEFAIMKTHPVVGAELLEAMRTLERVLPLVRHHHEKLDGSGYPDGLSGNRIPLLVRVITVVDVYDALATARPYRAALPHDTCMKIMREEAGRGWWDPEIIDTLDRCHVRAPGTGR